MGTSRQLIIASGTVVLAATLLAAAVWYANVQPLEEPLVEEPVIEGISENQVDFTDIEAGALVTSSPLTFNGYAEENWFSPEETFEVELQDEDQNVLGTGEAVAAGSTNADGMKPFTVTLEFTVPPELEAGMLMLKKYNPTGRPEDGGRYGIEVRFREEQ